MKRKLNNVNKKEKSTILFYQFTLEIILFFYLSVFGIRSLQNCPFLTVTKFKERTRIAHYSGLPELMSMFKQIADIRTSDTLKLDVPECEYKVVNIEATEFQK